MPLPGGPSDKAGNRYEAYWAVDKLLDVLEGKYDSIRLEPPALEDRGFEFWLKSSSHLEFHQVKRQQSSRGQWSLSDLASHRVLENFERKLGDGQTACVFISTQDVPSVRELAERARAAQSFSEFKSVFLSSNAWTQSLGELQARWHQASEEVLFDQLRRISIETIAEATLRRFVENRAASVLEGDPVHSIAVLFSLVYSEVHQELTAYDVWNRLKKASLKPNRWNTDPGVLTAVDEQNGRYTSRLKRESIGGFVIERQEALQALVSLLSQDPVKAHMVTGRAGEGKSSVMLQIATALLEQGIPLLSFRVDTLNPVTTPDEVGRQLGLPASPTRVLAAIAQGRRGILIMDQLDAVSKVSGRNPQFFDCLLEIIEQADAFPNLRLALACRHFDLENDDRLRRLISEQGIATVLRVPSLSDEVVKDVVTRIGLDSSRLTKEQVALLSLPFNLSLLARIAEAPRAAGFDFCTLHDLFALFWEEKKRLATGRRGRLIRWNEIVDKLCEYMSARQCLSVPTTRLDDYHDDAEALVSEHILVFEDGQCSFFHESLFDYAFARRFVARETSLATWLRNDNQDLFRRAQVRQILQYLRDQDRARYLVELDELVQDCQIRFHLKWIIFAWLAEFSDPSRAEWATLLAMVERDIPHLHLITNLLRRSSAWFRLAFTEGDIEKWLKSKDDALVNETIDVLASNVRRDARAVCELLKLHTFDSPSWINRAKWVLRMADMGANRCVFDVFIEIVRHGVFDRVDPGLRRDEFWSYAHPLATENPAWAAEAIGEMLRRSLSVAISRGETNPLSEKDGSMPQDGSADHTLDQVYRQAPAEFVCELLDAVIQIVALNKLAAKDEHLIQDYVWRWRHFDSGYTLESKLLNGIEFGLRTIAQRDPGLFGKLKARLIGNEFETLHFLAARSYAANGSLFADEAAAFLLAHLDHVSLGYMGDRYASVDLLRSISPFCEEKLLRALETLLLNFYPPYEKSAGGHKSFGHAQFTLLSAIDLPRRSIDVQRRLRELEAKFGHAEGEVQPMTFSAGFVASPIRPAALEKMSDDEWLGAVTKYNRETF